jgi:predicted dehydrogenase
MVQAVLVGCGSMSKVWLDAARQTEGVAIAGLVDLDVSRAEARAREFNLDGIAIGADLHAVLDSAKPDVVFDVVVPAARHDVAFAAFNHGCHLLTEKPLADSRDHARAIIDAARRANRRHAVVQNRRYLANVRRIRRFLDSGAIGAPTSIHADFFVAPHFGGFREEMNHILLLDMAIHTFDAARYIVNGEAQNVSCYEWEPKNSWWRQGSSAMAMFDMGRGIVFTYRGSWCADGFRSSWEAGWRIVGKKGSLIWDGFDDLRAEATTKVRDGLFDKVEPIAVPPLDPADRVGGHLGVIQDFIAAITNGGEPETTGTDNIKSLAMVFGAIESAETGRRVPITI